MRFFTGLLMFLAGGFLIAALGGLPLLFLAGACALVGFGLQAMFGKKEPEEPKPSLWSGIKSLAKGVGKAVAAVGSGLWGAAKACGRGVKSLFGWATGKGKKSDDEPSIVTVRNDGSNFTSLGQQQEVASFANSMSDEQKKGLGALMELITRLGKQGKSMQDIVELSAKEIERLGLSEKQMQEFSKIMQDPKQKQALMESLKSPANSALSSNYAGNKGGKSVIPPSKDAQKHSSSRQQ